MTDRYQRIQTMIPEHPLTALCEAFDVSRSGYYAWYERQPSARQQANTRLLEEIQSLRQGEEVCYGSPRMTQELKKIYQADGISVSPLYGQYGKEGEVKTDYTQFTPVVKTVSPGSCGNMICAHK